MPRSAALKQPPADVPPPRGATELEQVLGQFGDHLIQERGLASQTVAGYLSVARQFLSHVASTDGLDLSKLDAKVVSQFVVQAPQHRCVGSTKHLVTALRSLLRFLQCGRSRSGARRFGANGGGLARKRSTPRAAARRS